MNKVIIEGRICSDLTVINNEGLKFTVAVRRSYKNKEGNYDSDFVRCSAWGATAGLIKQFFSKGDPIICIGEWRSGSYVNTNGETVYTTECRVSEIGFVTGAKLKGINTAASYPAPTAPQSNPYTPTYPTPQKPAETHVDFSSAYPNTDPWKGLD